MENTVPARAFVPASVLPSSDLEPWHQASDQPYLEEASCLEGACKVADLACASCEEPGSWEAFPGEQSSPTSNKVKDSLIFTVNDYKQSVLSLYTFHI